NMETKVGRKQQSPVWDLFEYDGEEEKRDDKTKINTKTKIKLSILNKMKNNKNKGDTVVQWLALVPHSKKVLGSIPTPVNGGGTFLCGTPDYAVVSAVFGLCALSFSMEKNSAPFVPYTYLYSDGLVYDDKPVKVVSSCRLDIYKFPFDVQNCSFSFNSYLHLTAKELSLDSFGQKSIVSITSSVSVRRRATLYVVNLLIPSGFLITVDLFSFLLPPKSVDRSLFKMTLILGYTMFLLIMSDLLPVTGNTIPLINVFLSMCLALMVASLLETILVTNLLCGSAHFSAVPPWLQLTVLHLLGHLVMLPPKSRKKKEPAVRMSSLMVEVPGQEGSLEELRGLRKELQKIRMKVEEHVIGSQSSKDWIHMGLIIDRLLFILYVLFIIFSFISIIVIWIQRRHL
uniref:5-hydroxytryptamine (serotonin) receptor 3A n=1 Tax=Sphaeramia orbicularis TaxID=375764 RepID=A0A672YJ18_9TELE